MRWPRRGILIRLLIYVPLIGFLAWRVLKSDDTVELAPEAASPAAPDDDLDAKLAPYRRTVHLPDGTKQEIVELTPEQAEELLGHSIPDSLDDGAAEAEPSGPAPAETEPSEPAPAEAEPSEPAPAEAEPSEPAPAERPAPKPDPGAPDPAPVPTP